MINNGGQNSWSSLDYMSFYENALFPYQGISYCDYVFVPTVFKEHWWLYALNCRTRQLHVLDSIGHGIEDRFKIDKAMVDRVQHLFEILDGFSGKSGAQISLVKENVPLQPNSCDIYGVVGWFTTLGREYLSQLHHEGALTLSSRDAIFVGAA
ncbi:hypothetical protein PHAVU_001G052350 [Phaseolus vulgaris]